MNLDKQIIKEKLSEISQNSSAAVFAIGDHYVQAASHEAGKIYAEAVSHHYHSGIGIGLESSFASLGYKLEEGGNYSKVYTISSDNDLDAIANEFEAIFKNYYNADSNLPFEVDDVE